MKCSIQLPSGFSLRGCLRFEDSLPPGQAGMRDIRIRNRYLQRAREPLCAQNAPCAAQNRTTGCTCGAKQRVGKGQLNEAAAGQRSWEHEAAHTLLAHRCEN
jgi:hypothetical protein